MIFFLLQAGASRGPGTAGQEFSCLVFFFPFALGGFFFSPCDQFFGRYIDPVALYRRFRRLFFGVLPDDQPRVHVPPPHPLSI